MHVAAVATDKATQSNPAKNHFIRAAKWQRGGGRASVQKHVAWSEITFFQPCWGYVVDMNAMQIEYPESWTAAAGSSPERFESEARMALAMKMFEMGRLTSGQAAQLAGVSRVAFLFNCPQWNVPAVD